MSGGVDSSLTAYLLKEQGYEVEGISLILFDKGCVNPMSKAPCCSVETATDAMKTARSIGVKHTCMDMRDEFSEKVIRPFIAAYKKGLTPNPCILCNTYVKFSSFLHKALELGADKVATGHYACIELSDQRAHLKKAFDTTKDQSYFLYGIQEAFLNSILFPLASCRKADTV